MPVVDDADVLAYLKAENAYFEAAMKPHAALVETLFQEMKGRQKEDDSSVPVKDGDHLYWWAFQPGAQYRQWFRKPVAGGSDQLIFDEVKTGLTAGPAGAAQRLEVKPDLITLAKSIGLGTKRKRTGGGRGK